MCVLIFLTFLSKKRYFVSLHQHNIAHPQYTKCTVCTFPLTSELIAHETQQIKQQEVDYLPELIEETGEEDTPEPMEIDQPDQPMLTNASTSLDNTPVTVETSNVNVNANANATRGWFSWLW